MTNRTVVGRNGQPTWGQCPIEGSPTLHPPPTQALYENMRRFLTIVAMVAAISVSVTVVIVAAPGADGPSTKAPPSGATASSELDNAVLDADGMLQTKRLAPSDLPEILSNPAVKALFEQIQACFPEGTTFEDLFEQAPCYEKVISEAANVEDPLTVINAVRALVFTRPDTLTACHNGGHLSASIFTERFWDKDASFDTQLAQLLTIAQHLDDLCQNGFVHGFYDAIGKSKPGPDSFRAAAEVCKRTQVDFIDCGHGLGHTAWYATEDFTEAAAICGLFDDERRYRCDDGVIMYVADVWSQNMDGWSADPRSPYFDPDKFYKDSVDVCNWWPKERAGDPNPLRGCWIGIVASLLFRPISTLRDYGPYEEVASEAKTLARYAEAACMSLPPDGEKACMDEWRGMVLYIASNDVDAISDFCSALVKYAEFCVSESLRQLEVNESKDTEFSRVG